MSLTVSDQLLDLMAADDEARHLAALKALEEKRKITRAEMYLRKKFRYLLLKDTTKIRTKQERCGLLWVALTRCC
jgi:hypothetical protein